MPKYGRHVHALDKKINILADTLFEAGEIESCSVAALARYCEIKASTLKTAKSKQLISATLALNLSSKCKFDLSDRTWIDDAFDDVARRAHGYGRLSQDKPENFRLMVRKAWGLNDSFSIRVKSSSPTCHENALATFSVDDAGQATTPDSSVQLFLTVDAETLIEEEGFVYGFNALKVQIALPELDSVKGLVRHDLTDEFISKNVKLSPRGTNFQPYWVLSSVGSILDGTYITTTSPLCSFPCQSAGTKFSASLSAQVRDGSLARLDGEELPPPAKRAIIESLISKTIDKKSSSTGWITFGTQNLELVRDS